MFTVAQSGSAEVEAQNGKPKTIQRLHGVKDHLVVQRPAEHRMRMTDDRSVRGVFRTRIEQRFETSRWTVEKERTNR